MQALDTVAAGTEVATEHPTMLAGNGDIGALVRSVDWAKTPLGPIEGWSAALRMMVGFMLANRFPLLLWWGPHYISIYNEAYRPILGTKHPWAMGQPVSACWSEIWHVLQPLIDGPFYGGPATWMEDILLEINRHGFVEETHFTIAYSPVPDDTAPRGIGGVLATVHEITDKVVGERRIAVLGDLGAHAADAKAAEEACAVACETLARHRKDIPFALLYLVDGDGRHARLAGAAGTAMGEAVSPLLIALDEHGAASAAWPLTEAMTSETLQIVDGLAARFGAIPAGPWSDPPNMAVVAPIPSNKPHQPAALLVAGISPRLKFDESYRSFIGLLTTQVAAAIATARAYDEERKRAEALAEIDRTKTAFFSNVSHEFRTPLTLMLGTLEEALAADDVPSARRGELTIAHRNALRLLRLVNTLLDFSRVEAGRIEASYEPVDLAAVTADLASNFRSACERAGLGFDVNCLALSGPVYVDREMWEKIVLNLISNAFKFTLAGGVAVRLRHEDELAVLTVEDTGVGIPRQEQAKLFQRFHRVAGVHGRTHEGTGIGLALVQELVGLHGGSVTFESEPGRGSTFTVAIPLGTAHLPADRIGGTRRLVSTSLRAQAFVEEALRWLPGSEQPADGAILEHDPSVDAPRGTGPLERKRILVVDDNADMRDYVARLLRAAHDVEVARDGLEALDAVVDRRPDLVLSDVMMPRLDGFGLLRAIRSDPALADMPLILLSARAGEEAQVEGLDAGADDYLVKPFSARELLARVNANLQMAEIRRKALQDSHAHEQELRARTAALEAALQEQREAEAQRELLINELNHRVKNTLATVQSIAMQTRRSAITVGEFQDTFVARLVALSRTHDLLTRANWQSASFAEIVQQTLEPHGTDGERIRFSGPDVRLGPAAAMSLGMALHELATNAAKYGALSDPCGRVEVAWRIDAAAQRPELVLAWTERGGPQVRAPRHRGFGSRLIERGIVQELDGHVALDFDAAGVQCHLRLPLSKRVSAS